MKVEIKNLKVPDEDTFSRGTLCYVAAIYVDGVRAIHAENDGRGGADKYTAFLRRTGETRGHGRDNVGHDRFDVAKAKIETHVAQLPPVSISSSGGKLLTIPMTMEIYIGELITDTLLIKNLKNRMRRKVLYIEGGKVWAVKYGHTTRVCGEHYREVRRRHPNAVVLNCLSIDNAFTKYKEVLFP